MALGGRAVATRARAVRKAIRASRNTGSAALALAYVANGRFDAFLQSGGMSAWDVAAAGLIAERGGAVVTNGAGGPWFDVEQATRTFGIVAAPAGAPRGAPAALARGAKVAKAPAAEGSGRVGRPTARSSCTRRLARRRPQSAASQRCGRDRRRSRPHSSQNASQRARSAPCHSSSSTFCCGMATPSAVVRSRARSR